MESAAILAIRTSIFLIVFSLGLGSKQEDALSLLRRPRQLVRSLLAMNVIMPLVAVGLAQAFNFRGPVKIALLALAVSPVPPILPRQQFKAGGHASYTVGLLVVAAVLAVVFVPLGVEVLGRIFATHSHVPVLTVAGLVAITVLVPVTLGIIVRRRAPAFAARAARPIAAGANLLLIAVCLLLLVGAWPVVVALIGNGDVLALAAFVAIGLAVGHLLGGPDPDDRSVLALATASRHPGVALAIAAAAFPKQKLVIGAILLYLFVGFIVSMPYVMWRRRQLAAAAEAGKH